MNHLTDRSSMIKEKPQKKAKKKRTKSFSNKKRRIIVANMLGTRFIRSPTPSGRFLLLIRLFSQPVGKTFQSFITTGSNNHLYGIWLLLQPLTKSLSSLKLEQKPLNNPLSSKKRYQAIKVFQGNDPILIKKSELLEKIIGQIQSVLEHSGMKDNSRSNLLLDPRHEYQAITQRYKVVEDGSRFSLLSALNLIRIPHKIAGLSSIAPAIKVMHTDYKFGNQYLYHP